MRAAIYTRVSTIDQDARNQLAELEDFCKRQKWNYAIYTDTITGAHTKRPQYQAMMDLANRRKIDVIVVYKIDRLSRSVRDFTHAAMQLNSRGVRLIAVTQGIDTDNSNPAAQLLMNMLAAFAEFERALISERTKAGIERHRGRGKRWGRPRRKVDLAQVQALLDKGYSKAGIARTLGVSPATVLRRLKGGS